MHSAAPVRRRDLVRITAVFALGLTVAVAAACTKDPPTSSPSTAKGSVASVITTVPVTSPSTTFVTNADEPINVKPGQTFAIRVQVAPQSELTWEPLPFDETLLFYVGVDPNGAQPPNQDGTVTQNQVFRANGRGTTTVQLRYGRPGAPSPSDPVETFTVNIAP